MSLIHCARLKLSREVGRNEQPLNALLQTYKNFYPDVIIHEVGPFKSGVFSVGGFSLGPV